MSAFKLRRTVARVVAVAAVAGATVIAPSSVAQADTVNFSPIITFGRGLVVGELAACVGYIDVRAASDYDAPYPPNYLTFTTHFIGVSRVCLVDGTIEWRNLDTGQTGSRPWAVSGWDGPNARTIASIETGPGRVSVTVNTTSPHIPSRGQFTAS
ncbi:hypothetical protein DK926_05010 [Rhodococcus sp. Eu-32]|uniref:hypothetical protein n=1 Tax=Rhodococcus sp. Eu-32 TaxID=1017319 RepID=UPI000DF15904|nr:hypothetical protein [Rhodococcus sp. Eu-32]RRQ29243.1 hypothetical protein DK926_05010 [Rhodococcus sp. Eu-32]